MSLSKHIRIATAGMDEKELRGVIHFLAGWISGDGKDAEAHRAIDFATAGKQIPDACFDAFQDENT